MKDHNYVMRMMATGGHLLSGDTCKETVRIWKENREDVVNNFKYRHMVYNHNNLRYALPPIEYTWVTDWW